MRHPPKPADQSPAPRRRPAPARLIPMLHPPWTAARSRCLPRSSSPLQPPCCFRPFPLFFSAPSRFRSFPHLYVPPRSFGVMYSVLFGYSPHKTVSNFGILPSTPLLLFPAYLLTLFSHTCIINVTPTSQGIYNSLCSFNLHSIVQCKCHFF